MIYLKLIWRDLIKHPLRSLLTTGGVMIGFLLLCTLQGVVLTISTAADSADSKRLWVQSAVSLYVDLPLSYENKIASVEGVEKVCKFQWFGGYYQDPSKFFAQFAVDPEEFLDMYPEARIVEGSRETFLGQRTACMVGRNLSDTHGWKVGDTIPIVGALFPHPQGAKEPWQFQLAAIYEPASPNFDDRTMYFHWDYFEKTLETSPEGIPGSGTFVLLTNPEVDSLQVMHDVDALFANGPQRVQTTTEEEFQKQFISMIGNVPFFVAWIGGGVLIAILVACINTMLVAAHEKVRDVGIMKALGFTDRTAFFLLLGLSLVLCGLGGVIGVAISKALEKSIASGVAAMMPGFQIRTETLLLAGAMILALGLIAGLAPAWRVSRMGCVEALGSRE